MMPQYMLLIHDGDWPELSPEQMQATIEKYIAWAKQLRAENRMVAGDELKPEGRRLVAKDGSITDGPLTETRERIGGYCIITADSLDQAAEIAKGCPTFEHGGAVQVREINTQDG
jgi:hypothetical protein